MKIGFDITEVENYKEVCLTSRKVDNVFCSPTLMKCGDDYISLTEKSYSIIMFMANWLNIKEINSTNYIDVYDKIQSLIISHRKLFNGVDIWQIDLNDIINHIGLKVYSE